MAKISLRRCWNAISLFLHSVILINAVEIVKKDEIKPAVNEEFRSIFMTILTFGIIFLIIVIILILLTWLLIKIWKKLSEVQRKQKHLIYDMFLFDMIQCHYGYDKTMKKRNWKLLFLFWKRRPVYIENQKGELEIIGQYHGECLKKEGFFLLALYQKEGMFKWIGQVVVIPLKIKDFIVKKIDGDGKRTLILFCEGIDRIEGSDYYYIPLVKDRNNNDKFLDFSDMIHKEYIQLETYRDIIVENLSSYREGIIKSVETNPFVHFSRRGGDNFNNKK